MFANFLNWFSATPVGSWFVKHVASKLDPIVFRKTGGRMISAGPPTLPMLLLMSTGRKSGQVRSTQLAYIPDGEDFLIVASAMGQARHPGWRYNIEANPDVGVLITGEEFRATAELLDDEEKARHWPNIKSTIPQMNVYEKRTSRNIGVFRLRRAS
jgi:deazaflavin-dependent oxidoreductase (nitroreductase family)